MVFKGLGFSMHSLTVQKGFYRMWIPFLTNGVETKTYHMIYAKVNWKHLPLLAMYHTLMVLRNLSIKTAQV